jgi:hypothetical protein
MVSSVALLMTAIELGVFVTEEGNPTRGNILWNTVPSDISYRQPYIISVEPKSKIIEIFNVLNQQLIQTVQFPVVSGKPRELKLISLHEGSKHTIVASSTEVYGLVPIPVDSQVCMIKISISFSTGGTVALSK